MRQLWHHYYEEAAAIVFVLDAAQPDPAAAAKAHAGQTPPSHPQELQAAVPETANTSSTLPTGEAAATAAGAQQQEAIVKADGVSDAPAVSAPPSPSGHPEQRPMQPTAATAADGSAAATGASDCAAAADGHGLGAPSEDTAVGGAPQAAAASEAESPEHKSQEPRGGDAKHHPADPRPKLNSRAAPPLAEVLHSVFSHKHVQVSCSPHSLLHQSPAVLLHDTLLVA